VHLNRIDEVLIHSPDPVRVPLMGQTLCAGFPSPADDFVEDALELPRWLVPNPRATFLRRIAGSSMEGAGIYDRDLACIDRSLKASHGNIVVAAIDGPMSCKRLVIEGNVARLAFCIPDCRPSQSTSSRKTSSGAWSASRSAGMSLVPA